MSLNWVEIDIILAELSLTGTYIRQIFQYDYRNIYFQLFSKQENTYVRICLEQGHTRLHTVVSRPGSRSASRTESRTGSRKVQPRFSEFLRSRIRGGRIISAAQIGHERIVQIEITRSSETTLLYLKLWGSASNVIACDSENTILEAAYRRPKRKECAGEIFQIPRTANINIKLLSARPALPEYNTYNQSIAAEYADDENVREQQKMVKDLIQYYTRQKNNLSKTIRTITGRQDSSESADRLQKCADIILTESRNIQRGDECIQATDFDGRAVTIPLDPSLSPSENAQKFYREAKKINARARRMNEEKADILQNFEEITHILQDLHTDPSPAILRKLSEEMRQKDSKARDLRKKDGRAKLTFESQGFQIVVGRNARDNEQLLRNFTRGNDTWLHTRDYPGAYVFIKQKPGKNIPLEVLLDAGNLAVHYSKAKNIGTADLYYTQVKYLRRPKKGKPGMVLPTQEKNLCVEVNNIRMKRLLGG
ncbi:MAG: NFACT RNA binding domain-containing protein [Salinispira sp.]